MNTKSTHLRSLLLIVGIAMFTSCTQSTGGIATSEILLESLKATYESSEKVVMILTNNSSDTLYLSYCGGTLMSGHLEIKKSDVWEGYSGNICLAIYSIEFIPILGPGETKHLELRQLDSGTYRFNISYKLETPQSRLKESTTEFTVLP